MQQSLLHRLTRDEWLCRLQEDIAAAIVVPNIGESLALQYLVNKATPENLSLRLFKSNTTPAETDTAGTFTVADFTGYANVTLTGSSWAAPTTGDPTFTTYAQQSFTSSAAQSAQSVYGYYYVRVTGGELIAAERFTDGPYSIANLNDVIRITPRFEGS